MQDEFWVVGGRYRDTSFTTLADERRRGLRPLHPLRGRAPLMVGPQQREPFSRLGSLFDRGDRPKGARRLRSGRARWRKCGGRFREGDRRFFLAGR